jgi:LysM repeat protein
MNSYRFISPLLFLTLSLFLFQWGADAPLQTDPGTATPVTETPALLVVTNTPLDDGRVYHVVQSNETLWSIALAYGTSIEQLKLLNSLSANEIFIGQRILVARPEPATALPTPTLTATMDVPTFTLTSPPPTPTATPLPAPPASQPLSRLILGIIVGTALLGAWLGSWLGGKRPS